MGCLFGIRFAHSKCKILLSDWFGSNLNLDLAEEQLNEANIFRYLISCIVPERCISEEMSSHL